MNDLRVKFAVWGIDLENSLDSGERPVFCHPSYTIGVSLARLLESWTDTGRVVSDAPGSIYLGKAYTNRFKRDALWDFGDGTEPVSGQTASHTYEKPGRFTVSCVLFTSDRKAVKNAYTVELLVKEPLPTSLSAPGMDLSNVVEVRSGRVETIATVQAAVSTVYGEPPAVIANRVFPEGTENPEPHLSATSNPLAEKYWSLFTLEGKEVSPVPMEGDITPKYDKIYGCYSWEPGVDANGNAAGRVVFRAGIVEPLAEVAERRLKLSVPDPEGDGVEKVEVPLRHFMDGGEVPEGWSPVGSRGFIDLLYKADGVGYPSTVFLKFPDSPVNTVPLGIPVETVANPRGEMRLAWTVNGFIHSLEGDCDRALLHSLWKGVSQGAAIVPYIPYTEDWSLQTYIPKDLEETTIAITAANATVTERPGGSPWFFPVEVEPEGDFTAEATLHEGASPVATASISPSAPDRDALPVAHRRYDRVDAGRLVASHTPHEVFKDAEAVKESLLTLFRNGEWLDATATKVLRIFEDRADVDYCHVENLVSILKSMGEDPGRYDATDLSALNETMELARLLSMEHTDLVGHLVREGLDISFDGETKGVNLGDELGVSDLLFTTPEGYIAAL